MNCYYYTNKTLVIEYLSVGKKICKITTYNKTNKQVLDIDPENDSTDDYDTQYYKNQRHLENTMRENTYVKILYNDDCWINNHYQNAYEKRITRDFVEIFKIYKVYENSIAADKYDHY